MTVPPQDASGLLVVRNRYAWVGNPRLGQFAVYVDGHRVGTARLSESIEILATAGTHVLRVRLWWFLSPRLTVSLVADETLKVDADIDIQIPAGRRMLRLAYKPFQSLSLTPA
jgi:hypothetical protein